MRLRRGLGGVGSRHGMFLRDATDGDGTLMDRKPLRIDYTNWRGERKWRVVIPSEVWFGSTPHHPNLQWFLNAYDTDKEQTRDFALLDIHAFAQADE